MKTINHVALKLLKSGREQSEALKIITEKTRHKEKEKILKLIAEEIKDNLEECR